MGINPGHYMYKIPVRMKVPARTPPEYRWIPAEDTPVNGRL